jgi:hypothetical protein
MKVHITWLECKRYNEIKSWDKENRYEGWNKEVENELNKIGCKKISIGE